MKLFFTEEYLKNNFDVTNNTIYIFHKIIYLVLFFKFRENNISGGSYTKRHILSPMEYRLSQFMTAIFSKNGLSWADKIELEQEKLKRLRFLDENLWRKRLLKYTNETSVTRHLDKVGKKGLISSTYNLKDKKDLFKNYRIEISSSGVASNQQFLLI